MMSLTLVCFYIIMGLCFLLFVNYKFLKLFITPPKYTHDANSNNSKITNQNINNNNVGDHPVQITTATMVTTPSTASDVWSIPGPLRLPLFGTKWIYLWKYKMSKIHEVYRGESSQFISKKKSFNIFMESIYFRFQPGIWSDCVGSDNKWHSHCKLI